MIGLVIAMLIGFGGITFALYIIAKDKEPKTH